MSREHEIALFNAQQLGTFQIAADSHARIGIEMEFFFAFCVTSKLNSSINTYPSRSTDTIAAWIITRSNFYELILLYIIPFL